MALADPFLPALPPQQWKRGRRSRRGGFFRFWTGGSFALVGVTAMPSVFGIVLIVFGVLFTLLFPVFVELLVLRKWDRRVRAASSSDANRVLRDLGQARAVEWFAPAPWFAISRALLHARRGDPRASALAYADAIRVSRAADRSPLHSAQAEMLLRASDRREALTVLRTLERDDRLADRDAANLGIALLQEGGQAEAAAAHLDSAREEMGGHVRVLAGWAIAQHKVGAADAAREAYEAAAALKEDHADPLVPDLLKRAKKVTRTGTGKRARKKPEADERRSTSEADVTGPRRKRDKSKAKAKADKGPRAGSKKARKQARRAARKDKKAEERRATQQREQEFERAERDRTRRELERKVERDRARAKRDARTKTPVVPAAPAAFPAVPPVAPPVVPSAAAPVAPLVVPSAARRAAPLVGPPPVATSSVVPPHVPVVPPRIPAAPVAPVAASPLAAPVPATPRGTGTPKPPAAPNAPAVGNEPPSVPGPPVIPPVIPPVPTGASDRLGLPGLPSAPKPRGGFVPSFGPPALTKDKDDADGPPSSLQAFFDGLTPKKK